MSQCKINQKGDFSDNSAVQDKHKSINYDKHERVPLFFILSLYLAALSLVLYAVIYISPAFADFFNQYISIAPRFLLAKLTNLLPFSFAETVLLLSPILLGLLIWYLIKYRSKTPKAVRSSMICILASASLLFSSFVFCFASGYQGRPIEEKLGITADETELIDLYSSAKYLADKANELTGRIEFSKNGLSKMPYSFGIMNEKLIEAYDTFSAEYDFITNYKTRLKPVILSKAMSYAHITGIYSFFTGEANINVDFPDYTIPYTAAHEMAHQRGIAKEDEANLTAFLVCISSDDDYLKYCGYINMYEYIASSLYRADKELYKEVYAILDEKIVLERKAYNEFFSKYQSSKASQVSGAVNDIYLKAQGTEGKISYGLVTDLAVAYLKSKKLI